jgi:hypothetical protein
MRHYKRQRRWDLTLGRKYHEDCRGNCRDLWCHKWYFECQDSNLSICVHKASQCLFLILMATLKNNCKYFTVHCSIHRLEIKIWSGVETGCVLNQHDCVLLVGGLSKMKKYKVIYMQGYRILPFVFVKVESFVCLLCKIDATKRWHHTQKMFFCKNGRLVFERKLKVSH